MRQNACAWWTCESKPTSLSEFGFAGSMQAISPMELSMLYSINVDMYSIEMRTQHIEWRDPFRPSTAQGIQFQDYIASWNRMSLVTQYHRLIE